MEMKNRLMQLLHANLVDNNPDVLLKLEQERRVSEYLLEKIQSIQPMIDELIGNGTPAIMIEEQCLDELSNDLRPSKYNYLCSLLDDEFPEQFSRFKSAGILTYEVIGILDNCQAVFEEFGFSEINEDDRFLRYAITGKVGEYLEHRQMM
jgi:hypothetical protein